MKVRWKILILISLAFGFLAIVLRFVEIQKISLMANDLIGWAIGVLAVLVTILIGWQIYREFSLEERMNVIAQKITRSASEEMEREMYSIFLHQQMNAIKIADPTSDLLHYGTLIIQTVAILPQSDAKMQRKCIAFLCEDINSTGFVIKGQDLLDTLKSLSSCDKDSGSSELMSLLINHSKKGN